MRLTTLGLSDVGQKRSHNEDSYLINDELRLFVVADGMGGHAGGGTASRIAVETIEKSLLGARENGTDPFQGGQALERSPIPEHFREAVEAACYSIFHTARREPQLAGMGTTVTALLLAESDQEGMVDAFLAHVGDSRMYLIRGEILQQISEDHSLVNEQIKAGVITAEEARHSRFKNIITRSVGFEEDVLVDVMGLSAEPGDVFIMCSDGCSNLVEDREFLELTHKFQGDRIKDLPQALIDLANERGGDDNITVVVVRVDGSTQ